MRSEATLFTDASASGAVFAGPGDRYRLRLWRRWGPGRTLAWIMLNPSTADALQNDPTIRRCIGFAKAWGFDAIEVVNLFAFRTAYPRELAAEGDPIGPGNDAMLLDVCAKAAMVVAAWGDGGDSDLRARIVLQELRRADVSLNVLGLTKHGRPRHPLYMPGETSPQLWSVP